MDVDQPPQIKKIRHSKLAVAALAAALLSLFILVFVFLLSQMESAGPPSDLQVIFNRVALTAGCLLNPASILLGLAAQFQKNQKKLFGTLAICLSILVALALIVFLGMAIFTSA